jgi:hypothetical protein
LNRNLLMITAFSQSFWDVQFYFFGCYVPKMGKT